MTDVLKSENLIQNASAEQILNYLVDSGSIDLDGVAESMKKTRREKILKEHPYAITKSKDGKWRTYVKDETRPHGRRQIVKASEAELRDYLVDYYEEAKKPKWHDVTMMTLLDDWLEYKSLHVESTSIERTIRTWERYYRGSSIVNKPIQELTKLDLDEWIHRTIKKEQLNKHQYANVRLILNQELDYAVDRGIITSNPFKSVKVNTRRVLFPEKKKPDQTQVFSKKEVEELCKLAWEDFNKKEHPVHQLTPLAVMFMFYTGLRIGEVCAVRYEDIKGRSLHVGRMVRYPTREIVDHTKGTYGDRDVPLVRQAMEIIEAARQRQLEEGGTADGYIFSMNEETVLYSSVSKAFYQYCRKLGITAKSSHKARKTFVSALLDADVNLNTVRQIVGHTDERTTLNNYCYDRKSDEDKFEQLERALS